MDYIVTGLNMVDVIEFPDGSRSVPQIGGTPLYAWAGIRPFSKNVLYSARVGKDYFDYFNPWFENNGVDPSGLVFVSEKTPRTILHFDEKENYSVDSFWTDQGRDISYWRPKYSDLKDKLREAKGVYIASGPPPEEIWELLEVKADYNFKLMWEPTVQYTFPKFRDSILELTSHLEMVSFNLTEGKRIFGVQEEAALLKVLAGLDCELVLLRLGARGMYVIHARRAWFIPAIAAKENKEPVDVTGCGNAATAAACYGWCETGNPVLTGIISSVAAYYNLQQRGPYPLFTDEMMERARNLTEKLYRENSYSEIKIPL